MQARDLFLSPKVSEEQAQAFLSGFGFRDPQRADGLFRELAEATAIPERLADLAPPLLEAAADSADPDAMLGRLQGLFLSLPNPRNLISFLLEDRQALVSLAQLLSASNFIAQTLVRNPEYAYWLLDPRSLDPLAASQSLLEEALQSVRPFHDQKAALGSLRRFRRRASLRIAAQDVLRLADLPQITAQISQLAEAVLQVAFQLLSGEFPAPGPRLAVLAMGKLGGSELNFSSDIDLVYAYADQEAPDSMVRFARDYTEALGEHSEEGRLYRVDLRLRPMGRSGEIAYSLSAFRTYFETWADTTDRLAYLKCRCVAGDAVLGGEFERLAREFVFRKYADLAAVEEVRWLKRRTDLKLRTRGELKSNVKLGFGGIREIEFFAQAFQMLYGASHPELRTPNTLKALAVLVDRGMIPLADFRQLQQAYAFLRSLEHKLQLAEDQQTHTLPSNPEELAKLGIVMGLAPGRQAVEAADGAMPSAAAALDSKLERHSANVRRIFEALFEDKRLPDGFEELLLNPSLRGKKGVQWLASQGVPQAEEIHQGLQMLASAPAFPTSPSRLLNLLSNLAPRLIAAANRIPQPSRLFSRLDRLAESVGSPAGLYQGLVEDPTFAKRLFQLLSCGEFLSEILIANSQLLDALARLPEPMPDGKRDFFEDLSADQRQDFDQLRLRKRQQEFKVASAELSGEWTTFECCQQLSRLADACLTWAVEELLRRNPAWKSGSFLILALGKLGGSELTYHSDLDLVMLFDDEPNSPCSEADYIQLAKYLREALQELTEAGRAYQIDFRLRPEGRHGSLAISVRAFQRYFAQRLQAWERLAYVKARPVVRHGCVNPLDSLLWQQRLSEPDVQELARLRRRKEEELSGEGRPDAHNFKVGRGGLMDIQFIIQHLQIQHRIAATPTLQALAQLEDGELLGCNSSQALRSGFDFLMRLESMQRLAEDRSPDSLPSDPLRLSFLADLMGCPSGEELLRGYQEVTSDVRRIYDRFFSSGT